MPWRNQYITTRRHPIAFGAYLMTLFMGFSFLVGWFDSSALDMAIGAGWQKVWEVLLTVGGVLGLAGVCWPQKYLEDALSIESTGAFGAACGWLAYCDAIIRVAGWSVPVWLPVGALAFSMFWRAWQARFKDIRKLWALAEADAERRRA